MIIGASFHVSQESMSQKKAMMFAHVFLSISCMKKELPPARHKPARVVSCSGRGPVRRAHMPSSSALLFLQNHLLASRHTTVKQHICVAQGPSLCSCGHIFILPFWWWCSLCSGNSPAAGDTNRTPELHQCLCDLSSLMQPACASVCSLSQREAQY